MTYSTLKTAISIVLSTLFIIATVTYSNSNSFADAGSSTKFALVNMDKVIRESTALNGINEQHLAKENEYKKGIDSGNTKLQKKYQELESQKNLLSQDEQEKKASEIAQSSHEIQMQYRTQMEALQIANLKAVQTLTEGYRAAVSKVAQSKDVDMVLEEGIVPYSHGTIDLTPEVLHELNKSLPKIDLVIAPKQDSSKAVSGGSKKFDIKKQQIAR